MLYWLLQNLTDASTASFLVSTPGARALLAAVTAFIVSVATGGRIIDWLRSLGLTEKTDKTPIEDEDLRRQISEKRGTPTMGALIIFAGLFAACVLWNDLSSPALHSLLLCIVALAGLGAIDDVLKFKGETHTDRGVKARWKLFVQAGVGCTAAVLLWARGGGAGLAGLLGSMWDSQWAIALAVMAWGALIVMVMSNSVNISDGMDGLTGGLSALTASVLALACLFAARETTLPLQSPAPQAGEAAVFCGALLGSSLGFLIYNRHPAQIFMGDTGALAVGGSLGMAAVAGGIEILLPVVAFVLLAELASSLAQIFAFKLTGRRILPVAPLHHIFQKRGISEPRIVAGFHFAGAVCALAGLILVMA